MFVTSNDIKEDPNNLESGEARGYDREGAGGVPGGVGAVGAVVPEGSGWGTIKIQSAPDETKGETDEDGGR